MISARPGRISAAAPVPLARLHYLAGRESNARRRQLVQELEEADAPEVRV
jgi:hypothetical protein